MAVVPILEWSDWVSGLPTDSGWQGRWTLAARGSTDLLNFLEVVVLLLLGTLFVGLDPFIVLDQV